jgi:hypothetical protein
MKFTKNEIKFIKFLFDILHTRTDKSIFYAEKYLLYILDSKKRNEKEN